MNALRVCGIQDSGQRQRTLGGWTLDEDIGQIDFGGAASAAQRRKLQIFFEALAVGRGGTFFMAKAKSSFRTDKQRVKSISSSEHLSKTINCFRLFCFQKYFCPPH